MPSRAAAWSDRRQQKLRRFRPVATGPDGNVSPSVAIRSGPKRTGALKAWRILAFKYGWNKPRAKNKAHKPVTSDAARSGVAC
ncbi:hypothetical protein ABID19_000445 [Mesorhizobium robiniae]|uniref:Uncharacterized protein n=1 Tax=Mesorhizobium robiniae TaxID=559315 RepID=A0ABV2GGL6_9HYPH